MRQGRKGQAGFTLIELLVVILIVGILAAIAIPVFLSQREKGWVSQTQSALTSARTAAETYATGRNGNYSGLNGNPLRRLERNGYVQSSAVTLAVTATSDAYCLTATHAQLSGGHPWKVATLSNTGGAPSESDTC